MLGYLKYVMLIFLPNYARKAQFLTTPQSVRNGISTEKYYRYFMYPSNQTSKNRKSLIFVTYFIELE